MLADQFRTGRDVNAEQSVVRHVALNPLNLRPELAQDAAGPSRSFAEFLGTHLAQVRDVSLDQVFWHSDFGFGCSLVSRASPITTRDEWTTAKEMPKVFEVKWH